MYEIQKFTSRVIDGRLQPRDWVTDRVYHSLHEAKEYLFRMKEKSICKRRLLILGKEVDV